MHASLHSLPNGRRVTFTGLGPTNNALNAQQNNEHQDLPQTRGDGLGGYIADQAQSIPEHTNFTQNTVPLHSNSYQTYYHEQNNTQSAWANSSSITSHHGQQSAAPFPPFSTGIPFRVQSVQGVIPSSTSGTMMSVDASLGHHDPTSPNFPPFIPPQNDQRIVSQHSIISAYRRDENPTIRGPGTPIETHWRDLSPVGYTRETNKSHDTSFADPYSGVDPSVPQTAFQPSSGYTTGRQSSGFPGYYTTTAGFSAQPPMGGDADTVSPSREFAIPDAPSASFGQDHTSDETERVNHAQLIVEIKDLAESCVTLTSQLFSPYCACLELAFDYAMMAVTHEKDMQDALLRIRETVSRAPPTSVSATPSWTYKYGTYLVAMKKSLVKLQQMPSTLPMLGKVGKRFEAFEAIRIRLLELVANLEKSHRNLIKRHIKKSQGRVARE